MKIESGIYGIAKDGVIVYVGQSVKIRKRWVSHRHKLRNNIHKNTHLQSAWNKYGESVFTFVVLEYVTGDNLKQLLKNREDYWMLYYRNEGELYNATPAAASTLGYKKTPEQIEKSASKVRGMKHTQKFKDHMREVAKQRDLSYLRTNEANNKRSITMKGIAKSPEHAKNIKTAKEKTKLTFTFVSPDGEVVDGYGVADFAAEYGLHKSGVSMLLSGKLQTYKGWRKV